MQKVASKHWKLAEKVPNEVEQALSYYPPFFRQVLYNRGITSTEQAIAFLNPGDDFHDPGLLLNMQGVVDRLLHAIDHQQPIAVYGDYDVDGVSATALLVETIQLLGGDVTAYIPNRFDEGYGVNIEALNHLKEQGIRLVLTVDCGIRSLREAEHARQIGLDLIISDHHHPLEEIPPAQFVLCPKQKGDEYPEKNLAGVGVAYKIVQALLQQRRKELPHEGFGLDLVALGTVADVVPLTGENRMLVRAGLKGLRRGWRIGLRSLAQAARLHLSTLSTADIGFGIAPRLNAAGRLESALAAYQLLLEQDVQQIGLLVQRLDDQNRERQKITSEMQKKAEELIQLEGFEEILFAFDESFNPGVVGLVAGKLAESYYRPAVVGHVNGEFVRASCRSIPAFHITQALDACADLMVHHGGHALAAGFTVHRDRLPELKQRLARIAMDQLGDLDLRPVLRADVELPLRELHPEFLKYLSLLEPTGMDNPDVYFVSRNVRVINPRAIGADGKHLKFLATDGWITYDAVAFRQGHWMENGLPKEVDILYRFELNNYNGRETLQLNVVDLKPAGVE